MSFKRATESQAGGSNIKKDRPSASGMKFIAFTQSTTRNDGSKAEGRDDKYSAQQEKRIETAPDIDISRMLDQKELNQKRGFMSNLIMRVRSSQDRDRGSNKSMTETVGQCIQQCRTNPQHFYVELANINLDEMPSRLTQRAPPEGYACEFRVQGVFMGIGMACSKNGAREKSIENAVRVMNSHEVTVVPIQRRWRDRNYFEYVLTCQTNGKRDDMPPFITPPEGTREAEEEREKEQMKKNFKHKKVTEQKMALGIKSDKNLHHMGPSITPGKLVENFVIMEKPGENSVCRLNTSAQFCKMAVDFLFEEEQGKNANKETWICTVFVEGKPVADARGTKKSLKQAAADNALKCLGKQCHTVVIAKNGVNQEALVRRKEVKVAAGQQITEQPDRLRGDNIGNKMLKMMGWSEGQGLGMGETAERAITAPIIGTKGESINREGFGSKSINSDNITKEEAEEILKNYAQSDDLEDLAFHSEISFDERREIKMMAKRYGLSERTYVERDHNGRRRVFLVLSKKLGAEVIIDQLEREGSWGRYQLVQPKGGDKRTIDRFLSHQSSRPTKGFPPGDQMKKEGNFFPPRGGSVRGGRDGGGRGFGCNAGSSQHGRGFGAGFGNSSNNGNSFGGGAGCGFGRGGFGNGISGSGFGGFGSGRTGFNNESTKAGFNTLDGFGSGSSGFNNEGGFGSGRSGFNNEGGNGRSGFNNEGGFGSGRSGFNNDGFGNGRSGFNNKGGNGRSGFNSEGGFGDGESGFNNQNGFGGEMGGVGSGRSSTWSNGQFWKKFKTN